MNMKTASSLLSPLGLSLRKVEGDYRVAFKGTGNEASAYYTNDLDDAVATGRDMAARRAAPVVSAPAPITAEAHVEGLVRSVGPVSLPSIVAYLSEQWLKADRTIPSHYECELAASSAINTLARAGKIELYDIDAVWVACA